MTSWFEPRPLLENDHVFRPDTGFADRVDGTFATPEPEAGRTPSEEAAYEEGVTAGRESAPWAEIDHVTRLVGELGNVLEGLAAVRREQLEAGRRFAIELAVSLVEGLLRREFRDDPSTLERVVAEALASFENPEASFELALSPEDHAAFSRLRDTSARTSELPPALPIMADPSLERGCAELRDGAEVARIDPYEFGARLRDELLPLLQHAEDPDGSDEGESW